MLSIGGPRSNSWCTFLLLVLVVICAISREGHASVFYSKHTLPIPIYRSYFDSVGEHKVMNNRYETNVIIQEDILVRKRCECIPRFMCRSPRNIIKLQNRDCHHREKVCCEI
ncbi:uncharacterized protein LOC128734169 [Sabethes cyaneus]|uniref:uncharacterized protein LOC128734169 n=1 Tax=Sabethes cyaneus TaxID=53552 RepID=UPI00237DAA17|nr:uncharacterized protein LOC128734169 [Sabethes cyaneus]